MDPRLEESLAAALGSRVGKARPLAGGDINQAFEVGLADGRAVFVKCNVSAPNDMFVAEARGLAWLAEAKALRVPAVLAASGANDLTPFLALELIRSAPPGPSSTGCGASARSCAPPPTPGWRPRACGGTSNGCSASWKRCADRQSHPPGCTATCGAAT